MKKVQIKRKPQTIPSPIAPVSSKLTLAELTLQRGEFERARGILEKRIGQGNNDFKTRNMLGISLAHLGAYQRATDVFRQLYETFKSKPHRIKAGFNLGLAFFYRDLDQVGDLSVSRYHTPGMVNLSPNPFFGHPFAEAVEIWEHLLQKKPRHQEIIATYLAFAYLQTGDLDNALRRLINAMTVQENFFVTQYVLGRIFLDLYFLAREGNDYPLSREVLDFFEIESYEIARTEGNRHVIQMDTFLDIALQGFLEARNLNILSPEVLLALCRTYMCGDMLEEAQDVLAQLESLVPDAPATLEISLAFHEYVQAPPEIIRSLVARIKALSKTEIRQSVLQILPPYYLF